MSCLVPWSLLDVMQEYFRAIFAQPAQSSWEESLQDGSNTCSICFATLTCGMPNCRSPHCGRGFHKHCLTELGLGYGPETNRCPCCFMPDDATGLHRGLALMAQQKHPEAQTALEEFLASNPEDAVAHYLMGILYLETQKRSLWKARKHLKVACDGGKSSAALRLATILLRMGNLEGAERALAAAGQDPRALLWKGRLFLCRGDAESAKRCFILAEEQGLPGAVDSLCHLLHCFTGELREVRRWGQRVQHSARGALNMGLSHLAAGEMGEAEASFKSSQALGLGPHSDAGLAVLARARGDPEAAVNLLEDGANLNIGGHLAMMALSYLRSGRLEDAEKVSKRLKDAGLLPCATFFEAKVCLRRGLLAHAKKHFQQALDGPYLGSVLDGLSRLFMLDGDLERVRGLLEPFWLKGVKLAELIWASSCRVAGRHREAEDILRKLHGEGVVDAGLELGELLRNQFRLEDAEAIFRELSDISGGALLALGDLHLFRGYYGKAEEKFQQALDKGDVLQGMFGLGRVHERAGRFDKAEECFQRLLRMGWPRAWLSLGWLHKKLGHLEEARHCFQQGEKHGVFGSLAGQAEVAWDFGLRTQEERWFVLAFKTWKEALNQGDISALTTAAKRYATCERCDSYFWSLKALGYSECRGDAVDSLLAQAEVFAQRDHFTKAKKCFDKLKELGCRVEAEEAMFWFHYGYLEEARQCLIHVAPEDNSVDTVRVAYYAKAISPTNLAVFDPVAQLWSDLFQTYDQHGPLLATSTQWRLTLRELAQKERRRRDFNVLNLLSLGIIFGLFGDFDAAALCLERCPTGVAAALFDYIIKGRGCQEIRRPQSFESERQELMESGVFCVWAVRFVLKRMMDSQVKVRQKKQIHILNLKGNRRSQLERLDQFAREEMHLEEAPRLCHRGLHGVRRLISPNISDEEIIDLWQKWLQVGSRRQERSQNKDKSPRLFSSHVFVSSDLLPQLRDMFVGENAFRAELDPLHFWPEETVLLASGWFDPPECGMPLWRDELAHESSWLRYSPSMEL